MSCHQSLSHEIENPDTAWMQFRGDSPVAVGKQTRTSQLIVRTALKERSHLPAAPILTECSLKQRHMEIRPAAWAASSWYAGETGRGDRQSYTYTCIHTYSRNRGHCPGHGGHPPASPRSEQMETHTLCPGPSWVLYSETEGKMEFHPCCSCCLSSRVRLFSILFFFFPP